MDKCVVCNKNYKFIKIKQLKNEILIKEHCNDYRCGSIYFWSNKSADYLKEHGNKTKKWYSNLSLNERENIKENRKNHFLEKYGVDHNFKIPGVRDKIKEHFISKYGAITPAKNKDVIAKMIKTNNDRYGANAGTCNPEIYAKSKETFKKNYGVNSIYKVPEILEKVKNTNIKKYGAEHPMQNAEIFKKVQRTAYKLKTLELNGYVIENLQGYEPIAIEYLYNNGLIDIENIISKNIKIDYIFNNKKRAYYPDFLDVKNNIAYEVKSIYTYKKGIEDGTLKHKINATIEAGYKFGLIVMRKDKTTFKFKIIKRCFKKL